MPQKPSCAELPIFRIGNCLLDQLQLKPTDTLLDIGCGSGVFCSLAGAHTSNITGFDATAPFLEEARKRTPEGNFVEGDMEAPPSAIKPSTSSPASTRFNMPPASLTP